MTNALGEFVASCRGHSSFGFRHSFVIRSFVIRHSPPPRMSNDVDILVHTVLRHGIQLKDRLRKGEQFDLKNEQAVLKRLLLTDEQARQLPDFGSDAPPPMTQGELYGTPIARERGDAFLGVRYALVSWLDEMFLIDSPWDAEWNENK